MQGLMKHFVDYIKQCKTVALEDLAAEFGLRVQVAVSACCIVMQPCFNEQAWLMCSMLLPTLAKKTVRLPAAV